MSTKKIVAKSLNPGLQGRALLTYCIYRLESTFDNLPIQTILGQPISSRDPVYHLQRLNDDYFILSKFQGVLLKASDESFARQYLHETVIGEANSLAAKLEGFEVLDLTNFSPRTSQNS